MSRFTALSARARGGLMLAAEAFDHLTARVHEFHRAISDLPFKTLRVIPGVRSGSDATRVVHDGVTDGVYASVRQTGRLIFAAADTALRHVERARPMVLPPARTADTADDAVSVLSGFVGDHMATRRNPLAVRFGVYQDGRRLRLDAASLSAAFPQATPRVAVFLHGLCGNERVWNLYAQPDDAQTQPYGARLLQDANYTPVYLRYNSGLHVSINGRACARLLDRLQANWPVPLQEIVLIGHSMGGLVARSAADTAAARAASWLASLSQIICLGTPHLGAPLERGVHLATTLMQRFPLSRPVARLLDSRSRGIKDLRWGYTQHAEWKHRDPDAFWTQDRLQSAPLPGVRYRFLGTCLMQDPQHPLSRTLGDGLVPLSSSLALDVAGAEGAMRAQLDHLRLLNHPEVYQQLLRWIREPS